MANTTLNMQLLLRRDQTFTSTYVLEAGEPGFEISTNTLKIGDGSTTWANLPIANKEAIDALIKVVDDKIAALDSTYATNKELEDGLALKADKATYEAYVAAHANDYTNTQIDEAVAGAKTHAETKISEFKTATFDPVAADVATIKGDYTTATQAGTIAQGKVNDFNTSTVAPLAERVTAAENTLKTHGDIVTHNAAEFETAGAATEVEGRVTETLKSYYTKTEADAAFTTPAEVISEVNKALAEVSNADSIENISTLVNYVNENAADLTGLITEVYGSAEMTGNSRLDVIEAKAAMGITADDIEAWNAEKGAKAIVDANKAIWDKAETALQAADLADYAKTDDVTSAINTAVAPKLDATTFNEFNNGTSKSVSAIEADIVAKANAAQAAAEAKAAELDTALKNELQVNINKKLDANGWTTDGSTLKFESGNSISISPDNIRGAQGVDYDYNVSASGLTFGSSDSGIYESTSYSRTGIRTSLDSTAYTYSFPTQSGTFALTSDIEAAVGAIDKGVTKVNAGNDIVVTPETGTGEITIAHETFATGEYTKDPASSDKTGDVYMMTSVTVDNGHVTGANVKSLAAALEGMTFIFDGGTSAN